MVSQKCYQGVLTATSCTTLACLRTSSLSTIVAAVNNRGTCKFGPVVDGGIVPDFPSRLITNPSKFASEYYPLYSSKSHSFDLAWNQNSLDVVQSVKGYMGGQCSDDGAIFVGDPAKFSETDTGFINAIKARYYKLVCASTIFSGMRRIVSEPVVYLV